MDTATLAPPTTPPAPRRRVPAVVLEIVGYAGAAAAIAASGIAFDGRPAVDAAIGVLSTAVLLVVGWFAGASDDELIRLRTVFWFLAVLSWVSVAVIVAGPDVADLHDKWFVVVAALLTAVLAVPLYVVHRRSLQLIAAFLSLHVMVAALAFTMKTESFFGFEQSIPNLRWSALVTVLFGVAGMALGMRGVLQPKRTAMVLGAIAFLVGVPIVFLNVADSLVGAAVGGPSVPNLSLVMGLLAAVIVLLVGWRADVLAVIGLGILGLLGDVTELVGANVHETSPAIAVLILGLVMLAGVVVLSRPRRDAKMPSPPPPPEV